MVSMLRMRRSQRALSALAVSAIFLAACHASTPAVEPPLREGCNPLGGAEDEDCFLPFPSSYFTVADATAATGQRVSLTSALLPANGKGVRYDPLQQNRLDGYSAATTLLAYFPGGVNGADLPGPDHIDRTVEVASPAQLFRFDTRERVPLLAEIDENAQPGLHQTVILRPVVRLQPGTRYVALLQNLHGLDGARVPPLSGFAALRDGAELRPDSPRLAERQRFEEIFAAVEAAGVDRQALDLAWDFTTASDEGVSGRLVRMRDQAAAYQGDGTPAPPAATFSKVTDDPPALAGIRRQIVGTFTAPSFLTADADPSAGLSLGGDGEPTIRGFGQFPLAIHVPACAATATLPLPVVIYGHGSYSTALTEMESPYHQEIINRLCVVEVGTDWIGRAAPDALFFLDDVISDVNRIHVPLERLHQAQINVLTLAHLLKSGALGPQPELALAGKPLIDAARVYYYGISEGGIQGATFMALTPDVERGALNVPCGFWSSFFWRSSDFHPIYPAFRYVYPNPLDQQVLLALSQPLWDYTDPASFGAHLLRDPLPGSMPKRILYQEGINDASVPNQNTRAMVRTMGMPLLTPRVEAVFGVTEAAGPLSSGYAQFDIGAETLGGNDVPPAGTDTHETIRSLEVVQKQLQLFLREGGQVEDTCGGKPCTGLHL